MTLDSRKFQFRTEDYLPNFSQQILLFTSKMYLLTKTRSLNIVLSALRRSQAQLATFSVQSEQKRDDQEGTFFKVITLIYIKRNLFRLQNSGC